MFRSRWVPSLAALCAITSSGVLLIGAQDPVETPEIAQYDVVHADCDYFGRQHDKFAFTGLNSRLSPVRRAGTLGIITRGVSTAVAGPPPGSATSTFGSTHQAGSIDSYLAADWKTAGVTPAPLTTDWEFVRRVTLDLTGRIPAPARVVSFVNDTAPNKRAALIDELLAKPEWVDKWTMYFGDLYQNTSNRTAQAVNRTPLGRNAFYTYIKNSLAAEKPYNAIATELIASQGVNSYDDPTTNWMINGFVTGGPTQDIMDQATANVFTTFLGMAHVNCLLCHNGRGHLDSLSLWAKSTTRYQAWQLAGFLSHTGISQVGRDANNNPSYWTLQPRNPITIDYALNTTTGNRPARTAPTGCKAGQPCFYVAPQYIFNGNTPNPGEDYRLALARNVTNDFQFARATVNYIWAEFFGMGIVDPPDTFDPARLDPSNPPPSPWTLQPMDAKLLNALATHFVQSGYSIKALMREIANSQAYQLSSRYNGTWNEAWDGLFARKNVRRLWAEEVHDAVAQSSGNLPSYNITNFTELGFAKPSYAMQFPDVLNAPSGDGNASAFLDSFIRGNRDDQPRKSDGSILQALNLMNNPFIQARIQYTGTTPAPLIVNNLSLGNTALTNTLFLAILSRYPTSDELSKSVTALNGATNRSQTVQDLVWSLYNKVDFAFNY